MVHQGSSPRRLRTTPRCICGTPTERMRIRDKSLGETHRRRRAWSSGMSKYNATRTYPLGIHPTVI